MYICCSWARIHRINSLMSPRAQNIRNVYFNVDQSVALVLPIIGPRSLTGCPRLNVNLFTVNSDDSGADWTKHRGSQLRPICDPFIFTESRVPSLWSSGLLRNANTRRTLLVFKHYFLLKIGRWNQKMQPFTLSFQRNEKNHLSLELVATIFHIINSNGLIGTSNMCEHCLMFHLVLLSK